MKYVVIPDVHLKHEIVDSILENTQGWSERVIFLGDYFDDFELVVIVDFLFGYSY